MGSFASVMHWIMPSCYMGFI